MEGSRFKIVKTIDKSTENFKIARTEIEYTHPDGMVIKFGLNSKSILI